MSPITVRGLRPLLLTLAAFAVVPGLAACGGDDGLSQKEIEQQIDSASVGEENAGAGDTASALAKKQLEKQADEQAARDAVKRRKELEKIQADQKKQTEDFMKGDVGGDADDAADLEKQKFEAKLAGVCDGAQARITKVSKAAEAASKSDDPSKLLKVATDYNDALGDFATALKAVDVPADQADLYKRWLATIDDLSNTIRLQVVSLNDPTQTAKLQKRAEKLTARFLDQTFQLGVRCISLTA
ncbi:MAG: hypothetical protein J7513_10765 [Solirubrobacteraceae bacterium]|nr:hypothetical protein [Solirubrobacteraceae bacterium]